MGQLVSVKDRPSTVELSPLESLPDNVLDVVLGEMSVATMATLARASRPLYLRTLRARLAVEAENSLLRRVRVCEYYTNGHNYYEREVTDCKNIDVLWKTINGRFSPRDVDRLVGFYEYTSPQFGDGLLLAVMRLKDGRWGGAAVRRNKRAESAPPTVFVGSSVSEVLKKTFSEDERKLLVKPCQRKK